mgnify:CR=1 FL=1
MKFSPRIPLLSVVLSALIVCTACEVPRPLPTQKASEPEPVTAGAEAPEKPVLDPAAAQIDLQDYGMKVLWQQNLGQVTDSEKKLRRIYLADHKLIAETPDAILYYFGAETGIWGGSTPLKGEVWDPPIIHQDMLYVLNSQGLLAINAATGNLKNEMSARTPVSTQPVYWNGSLLLGSGNGKIVRFVLRDESHAWSVSAYGRIAAPPVVTGGVMYASGYRGNLIAVDLTSGVVMWSWEPREPSWLMSSPEVKGDTIYIGDNRGYLYTLSARDGLVTGRFPCGAPLSDPPVVVDDLLFVFPHKSEMLCFQTDPELKLQWEHSSAVELLATGKNGVYFLTRDGMVACVDPSTGEEKWQLPLASDSQTVSGGSRPTFYVASPSGRIMAVTELD